MEQQPISQRQFMALSFLAMLSPFLRLIPGRIAQLAGPVAWVTPVVAFPLLVGLAALIFRVLKNTQLGEGLSLVTIRVLGNFFGKALVLVWSAWLIFHAGFTLRSGADRFVATVYTNSQPWPFVAIMAVLGLITSLGRAKTLARSAELFRPMMVVVLLLIILFALPDLELNYLLPVTLDDALPVLSGGIIVTDVISLAIFASAFLKGYKDSQLPKTGHFVIFFIISCILASLICAITIGLFGSTLTARLSYPFFSLVRDETIVFTMERVEALVVGLWVLPDFILISIELIIASDNLMLLFGGKKETQRLFYWKSGGKYVWFCVGLAVLVAVVLLRDPQDFLQWSNIRIPIMNLTICFGTAVLLFAVGKVRKRI